MIDFRIVSSSAFPLALEKNLRRIGPLRKVQRHFLTAVRWHFEADSAWLYVRLHHNHRVAEMLVDGDETLCDKSLLEPFARLARPEIPRHILLAPLRVHDRVVGIVGTALRSRDFAVGRGRALNHLTTLLAQELARRDDNRVARVLDRIHRKALRGLCPKDLAYQILDALYQLIRYDHSAALLHYDGSGSVFRVAAEKIVWKKTESARIGREVTAGWDRKLTVVDRPKASHQLRAFWSELGPDTPEPTSILLAPLLRDERLTGALQLMSRARLPFDPRDQQVVELFLAAAAFCSTSISSDTCR